MSLTSKTSEYFKKYRSPTIEQKAEMIFPIEIPITVNLIIVEIEKILSRVKRKFRNFEKKYILSYNFDYLGLDVFVRPTRVDYVYLATFTCKFGCKGMYLANGDTISLQSRLFPLETIPMKIPEHHNPMKREFTLRDLPLLNSAQISDKL